MACHSNWYSPKLRGTRAGRETRRTRAGRHRESRCRQRREKLDREIEQATNVARHSGEGVETIGNTSGLARGAGNNRRRARRSVTCCDPVSSPPRSRLDVALLSSFVFPCCFACTNERTNVKRGETRGDSLLWRKHRLWLHRNGIIHLEKSICEIRLFWYYRTRIELQTVLSFNFKLEILSAQ